MLNKIILSITSIAFVGYGIFCFFNPDSAADIIGYTLTTQDATMELVAMYGGMQLTIGIFCGLGIFRPDYVKPSLLLTTLGLGSLAISRLYSIVVTGYTPADYTIIALAFEIPIASAALWALNRTPKNIAA